MMSEANDFKMVESLYNKLITSWNTRDADKFAECFSAQGNSIGFDGSEAIGRDMIAKHLKEVFDNHQTAEYIMIIKQIRFISKEVCILKAFVGMVPPGGEDINPAVNSIQTIVAKKEGNVWGIEQLQNTPAAFHGRPELSESLSAELRKVLLEKK